MLAERGERLDESVNFVKKALQLEPENGSFLDSLGWAYFKADKLDLAETSLRRAAEQLQTNSVIQDHYGDVLMKLGRLGRGDRGVHSRACRRWRLHRSRGDRSQDPDGEAEAQ
jgi:predicted Zn-dependent protease